MTTIYLLYSMCATVDTKVTQKSFSFATKRKLPLYFASASDGTNVVKVFTEAIERGMEAKENPPQDFYSTFPHSSSVFWLYIHSNHGFCINPTDEVLSLLEDDKPDLGDGN